MITTILVTVVNNYNNNNYNYYNYNYKTVEDDITCYELVNFSDITHCFALEQFHIYSN